jgi:hypothetical protein
VASRAPVGYNMRACPKTMQTFSIAMEKLIALLPQLAIPSLLSAVVYGIFEFLNNSTRLSAIAGDIITNPGQSFFLRRQFLLIRRTLLGKRMFSWRRITTVFSLYLIVFLILLWEFARLNFFTPSKPHDMNIWIAYSAFYFYGWLFQPISCLVVLVASFLFSILSIQITESVFRNSSQITNIITFRYVLTVFAGLLILLGFVLFLIYSIFPLFVSTECHESRVRQSTNFLVRVVLYLFHRSQYKLIVADLDNPCVPSPDDPDLFFPDTLDIFLLFGTAIMSVSVLFINPIVNLLYVLGIICGRIHVLILKYTDYRHDIIIDDPLRYIGMIVSSVVFVGSLCFVLLAGRFL